MPEAFRPLADTLRSARDGVGSLPPPASAPQAEAEQPGVVPSVSESTAGEPLGEDEARLDLSTRIALARLAAIEAYERAGRRLLEALAHDVLARELQLSRADLNELIRRALEAFAADEPVAIRVAPGDAKKLECAVPVRTDSALAPGDLILEVRDGVIDARLAVRLQAALEDAAQ
jgi:flagellar biosynthesis/type III secretory pathway protein FliH